MNFRNNLIHSFASSMDQADVHMILTNKQKWTYVYSMKAIARCGGIKNPSLLKYILNGLPEFQRINKRISAV